MVFRTFFIFWTTFFNIKSGGKGADFFEIIKKILKKLVIFSKKHIFVQKNGCDSYNISKANENKKTVQYLNCYFKINCLFLILSY